MDLQNKLFIAFCYPELSTIFIQIGLFCCFLLNFSTTNHKKIIYQNFAIFIGLKRPNNTIFYNFCCSVNQNPRPANSHAFPHCLTQFLKKLISHAISHIFDFWKNFPQFPEFWQKSFLNFQISEKNFPRFFYLGKNVSPISDFGKSENFGIRFKIFISHKMDISSWQVWNPQLELWTCEIKNCG